MKDVVTRSGFLAGLAIGGYQLAGWLSPYKHKPPPPPTTRTVPMGTVGSYGVGRYGLGAYGRGEGA